jgi:uncharacterized protein
VAPVTVDAPFSLFAGVDRTLAVLEGEGIVLSVEGQPAVDLTRASAPYAFAADRRCSARLVSGPILDLNMMTRRGRFTHRLERAGSGLSATGSYAAPTIVFCATGSATVTSGDERTTLSAHDAVICQSECRIERGATSRIFVAMLKQG